MRRLSPAAQPCLAAQVEDDGDNLIPFAKCSRVVSRPIPTRLPAQSLALVPQRYGDIFWESLSQRPSPTWTEEQNIPSMLKKEKEATFGRNAGGTFWCPSPEDLRRRQRIINELKKAQWSDPGAASEPLAHASAGCGVPSATDYPGLEEARAAYPQEEGRSVTTGRTQVWLEELSRVVEAALVPLEPPGPEGVWAPQTTGLSGLLQRCPPDRNRRHSSWGTEMQSEE